MNILLINHYAGSPHHGMEFRPYYLAKEWIARGHQVTIIASSVSHLRQVNPRINAPIEHEQIDGIDYLWVRTNSYQGNGIARLLNMFQFTGQLYRLGRQLAAQAPSMVIASSTYPYDIWPARRIARLANARLVFEVHDLWPLTPRLLGGFSKYHPMIYSMQLAENYAYRHADKVISLLPGTEPHMIKHGLPAGKFVHIPNGFDPNGSVTPLPDTLIEEIKGFSSRFGATCVYAGGHAISNALVPLIEAAAHPAAANIGFILVGTGIEKPHLRQIVRQRGLSNVLFLDPVPKTAIPSLLTLADIAYIGWHDSPLYAFGTSPNKLFDYMIAGLPVLHATNSAYDLVRDARCGVSVPADDVPAIAHGAARLAAMTATERRMLGIKGKEFVYRHHSYPALAQQFLDAV